MALALRRHVCVTLASHLCHEAGPALCHPRPAGLRQRIRPIFSCACFRCLLQIPAGILESSQWQVHANLTSVCHGPWIFYITSTPVNIQLCSWFLKTCKLLTWRIASFPCMFLMSLSHWTILYWTILYTQWFLMKQLCKREDSSPSADCKN